MVFHRLAAHRAWHIATVWPLLVLAFAARQQTPTGIAPMGLVDLLEPLVWRF